MLRSRDVTNVKPARSCRTVLILSMGNGFLTIHLFSSLTSLTTLSVLSFFGIIMVGKTHSELACHCNTPKSHSLWISFFVISKCFLSIRNGWPWYDCAPSCSWRETSSNHSHLVFLQTAPQTLVGAPVTMIILEHLGVCNCSL